MGSVSTRVCWYKVGHCGYWGAQMLNCFSSRVLPVTAVVPAFDPSLQVTTSASASIKNDRRVFINCFNDREDLVGRSEG